MATDRIPFVLYETCSCVFFAVPCILWGNGTRDKVCSVLLGWVTFLCAWTQVWSNACPLGLPHHTLSQAAAPFWSWISHACVQKHFPFSPWHAHGNIKSGHWSAAPPAKSQNAVSNQRVEKNQSLMTLKSGINIVIHYLNRQIFFVFGKKKKPLKEQMQIFFYTRIPLALNHFVVLKLTLSESKSRSSEID